MHRGDNHFMWCDMLYQGSKPWRGWVLLGGPWYDYLMDFVKHRPDIPVIRVCGLAPIRADIHITEEAWIAGMDIDKIEEVHWSKALFGYGYTLHRKVLIGFICENGCVPAKINRVSLTNAELVDLQYET